MRDKQIGLITGFNIIPMVTLLVILGCVLPQCLLGAGVVDRVETVAVVDDPPIAVELAVAQDHYKAGENLALQVRLRNLTDRCLTLNHFNINTAVPYIWVSINGAPFERGTRIHPGDLYIPPRGWTVAKLGARQEEEFYIFFSDFALHGVSKDPAGRDAYTMDLVIAPVFRLANGQEEDVIAVESNLLRLKAESLNAEESLAYQQILGFWDTDRTDRRSAVSRLADFLRAYPESPYANRVRYTIVAISGYDVNAGEEDAAAARQLGQECAAWCLEKAPPFSDVVLVESRWLRILLNAERADLLERAIDLLCQVSQCDTRFYETQASVGRWAVGNGVAGPTGKPLWQPAEWRKMQGRLMTCLRRTLLRGDRHAAAIAPCVLEGLERQQEWELLARAAALVPADHEKYAAAVRAATMARQHLDNR